MKLLITCPPMLRRIDYYRDFIESLGYQITAPDVVQTLTENELIRQLPEYDAWIIGDDPATRRVLEAGKSGNLKAVVKWGAGVDNVDMDACHDLGIPVSNTPGMFGKEVADIAISYVISLARQTYLIDSETKAGRWAKPTGMSLAGKSVALVGFGDIGRNTAKRLLAMDMKVVVYDPFADHTRTMPNIEFSTWPERIEGADFLIFTCALTQTNRHMLDSRVLSKAKRGLYVVNVARGALIDEVALSEALEWGTVAGAALEVFEFEPLPADAKIREQSGKCIFGSHNSSNTVEAVDKTSHMAIEILNRFLGI